MASLKVEVFDEEAREKLAGVTAAARVAKKAIDGLRHSIAELGDTATICGVRLADKESST